MNQHCGKHDKVFSEEKPCPGCENESAGVRVSSAQQTAEDEKLPEVVMGTEGEAAEEKQEGGEEKPTKRGRK